MSIKEKYQEARKYGYSDQEIMEHLAKKDPSFEEKIIKAQEYGYTSEEILGYFNSPKPKEEESAVKTYGKDIQKQLVQGYTIGSLGTYGDILDALNLQSKETLPGEKAKYGREFDILQREQEGHKPSAGELAELSDDDVAPRFSRLSSSQDVEKFGGSLGLITEPETAPGRYARRIGKIGGGGASLGATGIASPIVAGTAGQTAEEMGLPPWVQATFEIVAGLKASGSSKGPISSKSPEVSKEIEKLRKVGFSEENITFAKNALEERNILKKFATLTPKVENAIQKGVKDSEELFKQQVKKGLPGYAEGGLPYLEKQASNVYQSMEELASNIKVSNKEPFRKSIQESIDYMEKSALLPEEKEFIQFLKEGLEKVDKSDTADFLTSFYRKLGKSGKWTDPKTKEHLLTVVQKGIKDTFAQSGPDAAKFGKYFEKTNDAWKHWIDTRDIMQKIETASTTEGMNFAKMSKILSDPKNYELAKKTLGHEQLENIKTISNGSQAIESLLKQIKPADKTAKMMKAVEATRAFFTGSWKTFASLMGYESAKIIANKFLIDPKKQNIMKKMIVAAKNNSPEQGAILAQELVKEEE